VFQQFLRRIADIIGNPVVARSRLVRVLFVLVAFGYASAAGFLYFEKDAWSAEGLTLLDCAWWSFTTMTTVGYGDYYPKTLGGRWFVGAPTMLVGIGTMAYLITVVAASLIERRQDPEALPPPPDEDAESAGSELVARWRSLERDDQARVLDLTRRLSALANADREEPL
jgi:hypothetical protein